MISIAQNMDGHDIAGEIRLERQLHKGSFLLLEGITDIKRFQKFVDAEACSTVNCYGKQNLIDAIELLYEDGFLGVLGLADADFDRVTGSLYEHEGLIYSATHDLDADWACETSILRYINEVGDPAKCATFADLGQTLREGLKPLSVLRYLNEYQSLSYKLKALRHDVFLQGMTVDVNLLLDDVFLKRPADSRKPQLKALVVSHSKQDFDLLQMTSGHDLMCALGFSLRSEIGDRRSSQTWGSEVEMHFRLMYGDEEFKRSSVYSAIRAWERDNNPFAILAARLRV